MTFGSRDFLIKGKDLLFPSNSSWISHNKRCQLKYFLQRGIFCATCNGPLISIISGAARFTTAGERYLLLRHFICVRSAVPKQLYLNLIWSQMYTFVVYTTVSVLVTFFIFCKGDQQPPLPDSSSLSHLGNNICC